MVSVAKPSDFRFLVGWKILVGTNNIAGIPIIDTSANINFWLLKFQQFGTAYAYGGLTTGTSVAIGIYYIPG